jgi:hypothetical protein
MTARVLKYWDSFLNNSAKRAARAMRKEVRETRILSYIKRADARLPLFSEGSIENDLHE